MGFKNKTSSIKSLGKTGQLHAKELNLTTLSYHALAYDPEMPLLDIYQKKTKTLIRKDMCTLMFSTALFTITKIQKQSKCFNLSNLSVVNARDKIDLMDMDLIPGGFPGASDGKESICNARDLGSIPGLGRSPGSPLLYYCLNNLPAQRSQGHRVGHD